MKFAIEAIVLLAISIVFVLLRCLVRLQVTGGLRKLELDDWGIKVAVVSIEKSQWSATYLTNLS
jgi:predicted lysophospholipase L1 biosynthesis ABC-type transport system permease subunit